MADEDGYSSGGSDSDVIITMISSLGGIKPRIQKCIETVDKASSSGGEDWQENTKPLLERTAAHLDGIVGALDGEGETLTSDVSLVSASNAQYAQLLNMSVVLVEAVVGWQDMRSHQGFHMVQAEMEGVDSQLKSLKQHLIVVVGSVEQVGDKLEGLFKTARQIKAKGELLFHINSASVEMDIAKDRVLRVEKAIHRLEKKLFLLRDRVWWYGTATLALAVPVTITGATLWYSGKLNNKTLTGVLGLCASSTAALCRHFRSQTVNVCEGLTEVKRREQQCNELTQYFCDSRTRMKFLRNVFSEGRKNNDDSVSRAYTNAMVLDSHKQLIPTLSSS